MRNVSAANYISTIFVKPSNYVTNAIERLKLVQAELSSLLDARNFAGKF